MEYRYLGRTGVKVSELCLGCLTFGREVDEVTSRQIIARYLDAGGNFIDTANIYSRGRSEEIVGRALKGNREKVVLATKVRSPMGEGPNEVGLSRKHILSQIEASLRRLQTDYIDLYYAHVWDQGTAVEETLRAFDDLVRQGKVRYIGLSNFTGWQTALAIAVAEREGLVRPVALQLQYSLIVRSIEREVLPAAQHFGLAVMPWSPLARGFLSGKYRRGEKPPADTRLGRRVNWQDAWERWDTERNWRIIEAVGRVAQARGKTHAQVAINWLLRRPDVTVPIIGVTSLAQLEEDLGATGWELSSEEVAQLDRASAFELDYPYEFIARANRDR